MTTELNDWLREGQAKWELVQQHGEIVIPWLNPWFRFACVAAVGLVIVALGLFFSVPGLSLAGAAIAAIFGVTAAKYFVIGWRTGGVAAFVSREGCAIGCGYDRLFVPWSAIDANIETLPINDHYMLVPVRQDAVDQLVIQYADGSRAPWDRRPYRRAIVRAELHAGEGLRIYAYPNQVMVFFLSILYPVLGYRRHAIQSGLIAP